MASKKNTSKKNASTQSAITQAEMMQSMAEMMQAMQSMAERIAAMEAATVETETPKLAPIDERLAKVNASNAAILATVPKGHRRRVEAILKRVHDAGYPYARLVKNKNHQLDALRVVAGYMPDEKNHGNDPAFIACQIREAQAFCDRRDAAAKAGKPKPKQPHGVFVWSPAHGGQLYARGIFGEVSEA